MAGDVQRLHDRIQVAANATVRLDLDNEPQPDALLRIDSAAGGQSRLSTGDCIEGAPELIVEVAASSAAYDLHDKLRAYRRSGVREYVVWRVPDRQLDWFCWPTTSTSRWQRMRPASCAAKSSPASAWTSLRC